MSTIPTSLIQSQIAGFLAGYGEQVVMNRNGLGGTQTTYNALCLPAPRGGSLLQDTQEAYFDDNTLAGLVQPVLSLYLDGTCSGTNNPPQVLDTFTRDGVTYAVQKLGVHRVGGSVVAYVVFAAQAA